MHTMRSTLIAGFVVLLLVLGGCDLDIVNPNEPSEEEVLTTTEGIEALAVGMQEFYATTALEPALLTTGVTTREVAVTTTFANLLNLEAGGANLPPSNANVLQLWSRNYRVVNMAEDIIDNTPDLPFEEDTESGLVATAHLFKAMALGNIAQNFEQGVLFTSRTEPPPFVDRTEVFEEAIRLLENAEAILNETPVSDDFTTSILAEGIDLENTIAAYQARYHLFAGNYNEALTAADAVDPAATSTLPHDDDSRNPVAQAVQNAESYAPRENLGLENPNPDDARLDFFTTLPEDEDGPIESENGLPVLALTGFFASPSDEIPLYVPGELDLIRAEALVRTGNLSEAVTAIDAVRTKSPAEDPFGLGADLDPYEGEETEAALLNEILQQRQIELYLQGLRLEDRRRLGADAPDPDDIFARSRNFYPYPNQERQNNPNTPANPAI